MKVRFAIAASTLLLALPTWPQGGPSILPQCLDPGLSPGHGPSTAAKECTRQYCARPEYQAAADAYAMRRPQTDEDRKRALICITLKKQDQTK